MRVEMRAFLNGDVVSLALQLAWAAADLGRCMQSLPIDIPHLSEHFHDHFLLLLLAFLQPATCNRIWRLQMPSFGPLHQAAARAAMTAGAVAGAAAAVAQSAPAPAAPGARRAPAAAADDGGVSATLRAIEVVRSWRSRL